MFRWIKLLINGTKVGQIFRERVLRGNLQRRRLWVVESVMEGGEVVMRLLYGEREMFGEGRFLGLSGRVQLCREFIDMGESGRVGELTFVLWEMCESYWRKSDGTRWSLVGVYGNGDVVLRSCVMPACQEKIGEKVFERDYEFETIIGDC